MNELDVILDKVKLVVKTLDEIIDQGEMSSDMWDLLVFQFREMKQAIKRG